jgi:hypothetical protein
MRRLFSNTLFKMEFMVLCAVILSFSIIGCDSGGGGGGDTSDNVTLSTIVGTYTLKSFKVTFSDGTTVTPDDVSTFSGTMLITDNSQVSQTVEVNGTVVNSSATILQVLNNTLRCTSEGCEFNLGIEIIGNILTTTFLEGTCGAAYTEIDVWEKQTSASLQQEELNHQLFLDNDEVRATPGGGMGGVYDYLP